MKNFVSSDILDFSKTNEWIDGDVYRSGNKYFTCDQNGLFEVEGKVIQYNEPHAPFILPIGNYRRA